MEHLALDDGWTVAASAGIVTHGTSAADGSAPAAADRVRRAGAIPAAVPGSVHTDLLAVGLIPDPYLDAHESDLRWMHRVDWRWERALQLPAASPDERVDLVFEGIDTVATVSCGGQELARTENMHRSYRIDVRSLADGVRRPLVVDIRSATGRAEELIEELGPRPGPYPEAPFNFVRKMACSFGWDWGPDLRTAGLWKPVRIERWRTVRMAQVQPLVTVDPDGTGRVLVELTIERSGLEPAAAVRVRGSVSGVSAEILIEPDRCSGAVELVVPQAPLWWPAGYGTQPLTDLVVELLEPASDGAVLDRWAQRIGFRTVALDLSDDEHGSRFVLSINGSRIAVKGANWIPDDHFLPRITPQRVAARLDQAIDAHLNLIRVWGGGIYESDEFYRACDERGLLVWQDFLLACAAYPEEDPIRAELVAEAGQNVVRLMPHPSLVIWNGGNENVWGHEDWGWKDELQGRSWGGWYASTMLRSIVEELDPTRPYVDNSPYSPRRDPAEVHPNDPDHGSHHQWEVWNRLDYRVYSSEIPRFCSEFGFQGPPAWRTLQDWVHAADGGPLAATDDPTQDANFLIHQKADDGNGKLDRGMGPHLGVPQDFADWHWAAQLNQARAVRHAVEHYRSWWPRTAGWILWQLNDCWPVTSWAAIDSEGRRKPLWHALRQSAAPRVLSFVRRDEQTRLAVVNDTDEPWSGAVALRRETLGGELLGRQDTTVAVTARSVAVLEIAAVIRDFDDPTGEVLIAELDDSRACWSAVEDVELRLDPAALTAVAHRVPGGYRIDLAARSFVLDAAILADRIAPDAESDDMLSTLPAGTTASVFVRTGAEVDPTVFTCAPVMRSANDLRAVAVRALEES